jgi:hypothetical protein
VTITLSGEQERLIAHALRVGIYQNTSHRIEAKLDRALAFERGGFFTAESSRDDMTRRKSEWLVLSPVAQAHPSPHRQTAHNPAAAPQSLASRHKSAASSPTDPPPNTAAPVP